MASEFRLGWKPLAAATIGVACGASPIPFNVLPIVIGPMNEDLGWSFAEISIGITIYGIVGALLAPVIGALVDRHGVKPVALASLALFGVAFAAMFFVPKYLPAYFLLCAVIGAVGIGSTPVSWSRAISMWFEANRGLALGILLLGTSLAALVVPQIGDYVLERSSWRSVFPAVALLPLLVALPLTFLFFREPKPHELPVSADGTSTVRSGLTRAEALRSPRFYILYASVCLVALAYGGAHIHIIQIITLKGFDRSFAADVLSVVALGIFAGRILVGLLFDRFWAPGIAFPVLLLPVLSCLILISDGTGATAILIAGFCLGFAAGAESDIIAFMAARYFGMREYGRIYGLLYMPFGIFASISPLLYGEVRDRTGSYDPVLQVAMVLFFIGGVILLFMGRYPPLPAVEPVHDDKAITA
ncbi:MFS transporter [Erythrobacter sp. Dej080120_24]|uniref:MFS transporter n=1 Tax=Erythrobacter sp. Dej080120_24 TaxID=3024837 RepID=UPI00291FCDC9|nr:MFS transporter [Erythrobacter sp. Dej080120_24]